MSSFRVCDQIVRAPNGPELATILQLSDLHLKAKTPLDGAPGHGSFMLDLERALKAQKEKIDLVVITGDLVDGSEFWASNWKAAFAKASNVVKKVCEIVNVNPEQGLLVIPGNHDVRRSGIKPNRKLEALFSDSFGRYFAHSYYPHLNLLVACFDSNERVRPLFFDFAKGMAATAQCRHVLDEIEKLDPKLKDGAKRAFRLALIHHHLMAIPADDFAADLKLIGAPSLMMLRNAGSFLHRLLEDGYRLVLHGHLHTHGYWLPQTFVDADESPRWLELISCGWAGVSSPDNVRTFNIIKVHDTGVVESRRVEFQAGPSPPKPTRQAMAGYNLVRTRTWDLRDRKIDSVACDTFSQRWDVILPEGDVVVTEVIRGLRGDMADIDEMLIYKEAAGLTLVNFSAEYLNPTRKPILFDRFVVQAADVEETRIGFRLKFDQKLRADGSNKVDILLRSTIFGGVASSEEDQKYAKVAARRIGKEEIYHVVWRACGRLVVNVRFFGAANLIPTTVDFRVYDPGLKRALHELESDHITWDFWSSDRESENVYDLLSVPEANLSVYRPQLHHGYALEWDLPRHEPIEERDSLLNQRRFVLRLETAKAITATDAFLAALKSYVVKGLRDMAPFAKWDDPSLGVYLYAFDSQTAEMVRKRASSFHDDPFPERIAYGRDFIGTAFRSWFPLSFDRISAGEDNLPLFDRMPEKVNYLFACPLLRAEWPDVVDDDLTGHDPLDYAPVGVVGIASGVEGSGLAFILSDDDATSALNHQIEVLWRKCQVKAGWVVPVAATGA